MIGLPDTPVALHEINLEELIPRYAPPVKPTGRLKVQLQFADDKSSLNVIIIEVCTSSPFSVVTLPSLILALPTLIVSSVPILSLLFLLKTRVSHQHTAFVISSVDA